MSFFSVRCRIASTTWIHTLSLHDALPIFVARARREACGAAEPDRRMLQRQRHADVECSVGAAEPLPRHPRSEEHTSELQSPCNLVCRLLLEKKKHIEKLKQSHCIYSRSVF